MCENTDNVCQIKEQIINVWFVESPSSLMRIVSHLSQIKQSDISSNFLLCKNSPNIKFSQVCENRNCVKLGTLTVNFIWLLEKACKSFFMTDNECQCPGDREWWTGTCLVLETSPVTRDQNCLCCPRQCWNCKMW